MYGGYAEYLLLPMIIVCLHEQVVRHVAVKRINECRTYSDWVQDSASFTLEVGGSDPRGQQLLTASAVDRAVVP